MRFKHLSLDEQLQETEKTDEKTVAKAQLLKSKEWQDHIAEHHGTGVKAQLVEVKTAEDSDLFKKAEEKKKDEKEETTKPQHTLNHDQVASSPRAGYISNASGGAQRGAGDDYFGAGSNRLKAISGQCSCGMEVSTGWNPGPTTEQKLKSGYATPMERATPERLDQAQPLYSTGPAPNTLGGQQERSLYSTGQPSLGSQQGQKPKRTTAL